MRRTRSRTTLALFLLAALAPGAALAQTERPSSHTVRRGDTLWDLAKLYFGDPFLWPEIYRLNTVVVEDPHWIYPGEVLRLVGGPDVAAVPDTDTPVDSAALLPQEAPDTAVEVAQAEEPAEEVQGGPLFGPPPSSQSSASDLRTYREQAYRALRPSEFYASGFLSEEEPLPFGRMLGSVSPQYIGTSMRSRAVLFSKIAVVPPAGGSYQVGDTLLLVRVDRTIPGYGDVVVPTGLARVTDVSRKENLAVVLAEYGSLRPGQYALPAERFVGAGSARPVPVADGVEGRVIEGREPGVFKTPQDVIFIDVGRRDGVARGDLFEVWRTPQTGGGVYASTIAEPVATLQIVHVRERTATARILTVSAPDLPPGSKVRQVAKLPG